MAINEEHIIHEYVHTHTHTHTCMYVYNVAVSSITLIRLQAVTQKPNPDINSFEILTKHLLSNRLALRNS